MKAPKGPVVNLVQVDIEVQGTVRAQFIVDKEGNLSEVKTLNNPAGGLAEQALRILRKSPAWRPAEQNGRRVKYIHVQP